VRYAVIGAMTCALDRVAFPSDHSSTRAKEDDTAELPSSRIARWPDDAARRPLVEQPDAPDRVGHENPHPLWP
jgi:hypothetical protein